MVFKFKLMALAALVAGLSACGGGGSEPATPNPVSGSPALSSPVTASPAPPAPTSTPSSTYATGSAEKAMFEKLNLIRISGGFGGITQSPLIDLAAKAHAIYISINYLSNGSVLPQAQTIQADGTLTPHTETIGATGFTGSRVVNRVMATGYSQVTVGEVIGLPYSTFQSLKTDTSTCLDGLIGTVFHRATLLDTAVQEVGIGFGPESLRADGAYGVKPCVLDLGSQYAARALPQGWIGIYPFDGQRDVAARMVVLEVPDPVPGVPVKGMPISFQTATGQTLVVNTFTLQDAAGSIVAGTLLTRAQSIYLRPNEAYFVPTGALMPKTNYTVSFKGTSSGLPVSKARSFTTAL